MNDRRWKAAPVTAAATTAAPIALPAETSTTTTTVPVDTGARMIVQVLAHRPTTSRADVSNALSGDVSSVIDEIEYDLASVSTIDPTTGEPLLQLDVPISQVTLTSSLELVDPGVYPITVNIRRDGILVASAITFLERLRTDGISLGPLSLAVVASVDEISTLPTDSQREV